MAVSQGRVNTMRSSGAREANNDPIYHDGHLFVSSFLGSRCSLFKVERDKLIEVWQHLFKKLIEREQEV